MQKQITQHEYFTKFLSPANPIITKQVQLNQQAKIALKQSQSNLNQNLYPSLTTIVQQQQQISQNQQLDRFTLLNGYTNKSLVYRKYDNSQYRKRCNKQYYASIFCDVAEYQQFTKKSEYIVQVNGIKFGSAEQSMNLFAVYQTGNNQFDLILQNDINTCGYTQWFYFSVFNKQKSQTIKINIINLYKSKSLYNSGMKPLAISKKSSKGWQRAGVNVIYTDNQIYVQHSKKYYRTLSFEHTFLQENNQTQFAHCFPYSYANLKQKLKSIQKCPRTKIRTLGTTCMKKPIPIVQFSQEDPNPNKKAIIIMARQHPGETVGSLVMDQILSQLTKVTTQNQFLFWRFNIYCIPIVNIDGVVLGNYRGNAYGYDLNRCWDRQNINKLPQLCCIKKQIKRIQKKYPIQLILDLHGHSRKMGSFFYGNPFGKNTGLFAYVASNMSQSISFQDSTFQKQKSQKVTTARIVLGNMIKDTGCFYTYQTSFYGSVINGKKVHFTQQNFQQLGKTLLSATYKTFIEISKQEKTLKQSLFLKQVRKQLAQLQKIQMNKQSSGSDSQAQAITQKQMQIKTKQESKKPTKELILNENANTKSVQILKVSIQIQAGDGQICQSDINCQVPMTHMVQSDISARNIRKQGTKNQKRIKKLGSVSEKYSLYVGFQKSDSLQESPNKPSHINDSINRKNFLLQKLRPNPKQTSKQTQTNFPLNIQCLSKKSVPAQQQSPTKSPQFRNRKHRNKSLIIRLDNRQKLAMADIVKVNRLQYKKIQRDSLVQTHRRQLQKDMKINMLPNIN